MFARRMTADNRLHTAIADFANEGVGIVAGVANECSAASVIKELFGDGHLMAMTGREHHMERSALAVGDRVELGRESSSTTTQTIGLDPPFPPAASWCARITLPS